MKVILLQDVRKIGKKNDIKDLPDGYAQNFLIAKKLAKVATPDVIAKLNKDLGNKKVGEAIQTDLLLRNIKKLEGKPLVIRASANEKGGLFKAIRPTDIALEIKKQHGFELDPAIIFLLDDQIKQLGEVVCVIKRDAIRQEVTLDIVKK